MEKKNYLSKLGFEMKSPQRDLMNKVVCNALGDVDHTPLVGKELPLILNESKDNLVELRIAQILYNLLLLQLKAQND